MNLTHFDTFSGLGGFAVAAAWAGFRTIGFCESDPRCQAFLRSAWGLPVADDIDTLDITRYGTIDLLTGGPPCQPASRAGQRRGASDDRWKWPQALRVLAESKASSFVFENPAGILELAEYRESPPMGRNGIARGNVGDVFTRRGRGLFDSIVGQCESLGYEVVPFLIPACAVDSPQLRERLWLVGFLAGANCERGGKYEPGRGSEGRTPDWRTSPGNVAGADRDGRDAPERRITGSKEGARSSHRDEPDRRRGDMADTAGPGREGTDADRPAGRDAERGSFDVADRDNGRGGSQAHQAIRAGRDAADDGREHDLADTKSIGRRRGSAKSGTRLLRPIAADCPWSAYEWTACGDGKVRRTPDQSFHVVNGLHRSVLKALGNSVVPQLVFPILDAVRRVLAG